MNNKGEKIFTAEQRAAIDKDQGSILVSAAAGSGKTTVLTERILKKISDGKDIRRYVVVTFTKTAAAEMKSRLLEKINSVVSKTGDPWYKKQLMRIQDAYISTIDSFCLDIIAKYRSLIPSDGPVPVGAKIGQEEECGLLLNKAVNDTLEKAYLSDDAELMNLSDIIGKGSFDDSCLKASVKKLYTSLRSNVNGETWKNTCIESYGESYGSIDTNRWVGFMYEKIYSVASYYYSVFSSLYPEPGPSAKAYLKCHDALAEMYAYSEKLACASAEHRFDECMKMLGNLPSVSIGRHTPEEEYTDWCEKIKNVKKSFKTDVESLADKWLVFDAASLADEGARLQPAIRKLFSLAEETGKRYAALKKEKNVCDFIDIELQVFHLLWSTDENGSLVRTELSYEIGNEFDEILIDEYQDVNELQDYIFRGISSCGEDNVFMVGDVKQCIYRFRGSDPSLFIRHREAYSAYDSDKNDEYPMNIALNGNFRSRKCVTDSVNVLFKGIMQKSTCGMDYLKSDELIPEAKYTDNGLCGSYFTLMEKEDETDTLTGEAKYVAGAIKKLFADGFKVTVNENEARPLEYGDIAVLLRTSKGKAASFAAALLEEGIPAINVSEDGYMSSVSVQRMVAVLQAIDNPMIDINLVTAMRSGVFGFDESDLMEIRSKKSGVFYYAVKQAAEDGNAKAAGFLDELELYREKAGSLTADKLIWYIYKKSGYLTYIGSLPDGKRERACLMRLYEKAKSFGSMGRQDLSGFVVHLKKIISQNIDSRSAAVASSDNEVKVINVHKAKGLEYPVCFICDVFKKFNLIDRNDSLLIDGDDGVALKMSVPESHRIKDTLPLAVLREKIRKDTLAEEMRLLYVAMTRAREYLEIVGTVKNYEDYKTKVQDAVLPDGKMSGYNVLSANSWGEWVAPIALHSPCFVSRKGLAEKTAEAAEDSGTAKGYDSVLADAIFESMNRVYAHGSDVKVPNAMSVSRIIALKAEKEYDSETCCQRKPVSCYPGMVSGTEAGTAMHEFLHYVRFDAVDDPEKEIERMVREKFITDRQGGIISRRKLNNVITSDLFKRIASSDDVRREFVFDIEVPACEYIDNAPEGETILVRGAIDCLFRDHDGRYVIVDYKTDAINRNLKEKIECYSPQVKMYARAFTEITGYEVSEGILYFLDWNKTVKVI